tara:strand:- start:62 stop:520 length:459 start_codon:yes stop_codon:yes gene_type:complete
MNELLKPFLLNDEFIFNGTIDQLNEKIRFQNNKKFRTDWIQYNEFKFFSKWSFGTLVITGIPNAFDGIKGYANLQQIGENKTKVELRTKVRIELYIFLVFIIFICVIGFIADSDFPSWILILIPSGLLWFWFVYRVQERILFNQLKNYLVSK